MSATLRSISSTDSDDYEVVLDLDGRPQSMRCRVVERQGIRVVQPEPDLLSRLPFPPRVLVAAVLAFDEVRRVTRS
jgi:hypothetical protein